MFTREQAQYQFFQQSAFNTDPGTPNGILVPRDSDFDTNHSRAFLENPQIQTDGAEREPALGNHMSDASGSFVPNLSFWPHLQKALCTTLTTTGAGPYTHVGKLTPGAVLLHLFEFGIIGGALWYKYYDLVLQQLSLQIPVEGIFKVGTKWEGSGNAVFAGATSLDVTPTEVTGAPGEYANMTILENAIDTGLITDLSIEVNRKIVWKRPHNKSGKASEAKFGSHRVSGTLKTLFETDALWAKARNATLTSLKATIVSGADSLEVLMNEVRIKPVGPKTTTEDGIEQSFEYKSIKKANADSPIKFTTINTVATY